MDNLTTALSLTKRTDKDIFTMQRMVMIVNIELGWFDAERTFGDDIALLHSEVSEAFEEFRTAGMEDRTATLCCHSRFQADWDKHNDTDHVCKPEGVGSELADILVRLLDTCERYNINLEDEFNRKVAYNATRGYRHGNKRV